MTKIKVTQVRSKIRCTSRQKKTLESLGLRKLNATVEHEENPVIMGMVDKVRHLVSVSK
jgi:large subunit ribosomal protein L30